MMTQQDRDKHVHNGQEDNLWVKLPDNDITVCQTQDFNDCGLIQEEYLRNLEMTDNKEKPYPPESQITRTLTDK